MRKSSLTTWDRQSSYRVVLADDSAEFMANLCELLDREWEVVATVGDGLSALRACAELHPDFVILDISMGDVSGIEVAKQLTGSDVPPKILFLSIHEELEIVLAALSASNTGYVLKSRAATDVPRALQALKNGRRFVSPGLPIAAEVI